MKRTATQVLRQLEARVARLERTSARKEIMFFALREDMPGNIILILNDGSSDVLSNETEITGSFIRDMDLFIKNEGGRLTMDKGLLEDIVSDRGRKQIFRGYSWRGAELQVIKQKPKFKPIFQRN